MQTETKKKVFTMSTRAVRGSDYNPATALSEEKDK